MVERSMNTCGSCRWWEGTVAGRRAACRSSAPISTAGLIVGVFPLTSASDWCREWTSLERYEGSPIHPNTGRMP